MILKGQECFMFSLIFVRKPAIGVVFACHFRLIFTEGGNWIILIGENLVMPDWRVVFLFITCFYRFLAVCLRMFLLLPSGDNKWVLLI